MVCFMDQTSRFKGCSSFTSYSTFCVFSAAFLRNACGPQSFSLPFLCVLEKSQIQNTDRGWEEVRCHIDIRPGCEAVIVLIFHLRSFANFHVLKGVIWDCGGARVGIDVTGRYTCNTMILTSIFMVGLVHDADYYLCFERHWLSRENVTHHQPQTVNPWICVCGTNVTVFHHFRHPFGFTVTFVIKHG